jgi:hypothetical protein
VPLKHSLLAIALAILGCRLAPAQISPGPLSRAHQQYEGVTKCASCHDFGPGTGNRNFKCLECHVEIQHRLDAHTGYHAREYKSSAGETDCARCHADHNGEKFALVRLDRKAFDHTAETGLALEGKHKTLACEKCHIAKFVAAIAKPEIKVKDLNHTFLGLRRECASCHEDVHKGQEGADCARCHTQDAWKPAPGFDHGKANYQLTGKHQTVVCEKCHEPPAKGQPVLFKGLKFNNCQDCHMDPHRGGFQETKFKGNCETCHITGGWKINHPDKEFDHSTTKYPLKGKHVETPCAKCHKDSDYHRHLAFERCADCHDRDDPHKGQFKARAAGSDCKSCHDEKDWKKALFDKETHKKSAFPLEGKHADVECLDCHQPKGPDAVWMTRKLICSACHTDRHGGEFAAAPNENKCDACHTQTDFQPSTFSVKQHSETKFTLTGRHAYVLCADCHKLIEPAVAWRPVPAIAAMAVPAAKTFVSGSLRQYHFASQTCETCHTDPHQTTLACESCHMTEQWKILKAFDHSTTKFQLDGGHVKVKCGDCHMGATPQFPMTPEQCTGCHATKDVHGGQFRRGALEEDCATCHVTARWELKDKDFSHEKTRFPLDVAHRNVACDKCHKEQRGAAGKMMKIYRGIATECVQCH